MKRVFRSAAIGLLLVIMVLVSTAFVDKYYHVDKKLMAIESLINTYYVGQVEPDNLQEGMYKGFVAGAGDVYTTYYTPKEFSSFMEKANGYYVGIGVQMTIDSKDNSILIVNVYEGSSAETAGIKKGDKIINVAGTTVNGSDYENLPNMIKGEEGTSIALTIYRPSEDKEHELTIERKSVPLITVNSEELEEGIGYIQITNFEKITYTQFVKALEAHKEDKGIILDLRNNPGGGLDETAKIANEILPKGLIVSTKDKKGTEENYYSEGDYNDIPMVVLINGSSASASEVLSGALKDYGRAKLVGETTYGKGVVQSVIPFKDGSALKLTTAQYFLPSGICIQGIGIDPDYEVSLSPEKFVKGSALSKAEDDQLQKALEVLRQEIGK